jgi:hypothetical protein
MKITDQEVQELQALRENLLNIITSIGEAHLNAHIMDKQLAEIRTHINTLEQAFEDFQKTEKVLMETLQQKYGTVNVDMETGEILG